MGNVPAPMPQLLGFPDRFSQNLLSHNAVMQFRFALLFMCKCDLWISVCVCSSLCLGLRYGVCLWVIDVYFDTND